MNAANAGVPNAYQEDLAYIHDTGYGGFARGAAPGLLEWLREAGIHNGLIVDFGCGSGIWARELTDAGYRVLGVDISPAMIEIARRRTPSAEFHVSSFLRFPIPACRAVTALGEVFNYLFDEEHSHAKFAELCGKIYDALHPGGMLVFDVANPDRFQGYPQAFTEGDDWTCLVEYQHDPERKRLTRRIITFRKVGENYRRGEERHTQQLFATNEVLEILSRIGYEARATNAYGEFPLMRGVDGFVARKPLRQGGAARLP